MYKYSYIYAQIEVGVSTYDSVRESSSAYSDLHFHMIEYDIKAAVIKCLQCF